MERGQSRDVSSQVGLCEARPVIFPDKFSGEEDFSEWTAHFNSVSLVNCWNDDEKYRWLNVHVTGKARVTLSRLQERLTQPTYLQAIEALRLRFDPPVRKELFKVELQGRSKAADESWGDYGDAVDLLVRKAYPDLEEKAKDMLALNKFLDEIKNPQIALAVRQLRPRTVSEALQAIIEFESYLAANSSNSPVQPVTQKGLGNATDDQEIMEAIAKLVSRIDALETLVKPNEPVTHRDSKEICCRRERYCHKVCNEDNVCQDAIETMQPVKDKVDNIQTKEVSTITVNSVSNYSISANVGGVWVSFLVDTGAAVSLIDGNVWDNIKSLQDTVTLNPVATRLVGVDGVPLQVRGSAVLDLSLKGLRVEQNLIVADSLTSQGILGMDFLESHHCILDLANGKLSTGGKTMSLDPSQSSTLASIQMGVTVEENFTIAAESEMEIMGTVSDKCNGTWLVEDLLTKKPPLLIARAVVTPLQGRIPVRVLNLKAEPITVYKGTRIATAELLGRDIETVSVVSEEPDVEKEYQSLVEKVMETLPTDLSNTQKEQINALLMKYAHVFATSTSDLGRTSALRHRIETTGAPIRQGVRRTPPLQREAVKKMLDEMKAKNIVSPSNSPWASPIVLVPKKDGSIRLCVDYRKVNEVTRKDAYPIPRVDDTLDTLAGSQWFSTLDLKSGYWQVEVHEDDREKTAFCTHEGLFQFNVMPFGLCNAPATFQRLMDMVLQGLLWNSCLVYIDDIIIFGKTFEEHLGNLARVFERVEQAGLKLQPQKCHLLQSQVQFLGHIISTNGVAPDPQKTEKVKQWQTPQSVKEVQQFLGLASYYRRFIKNFASVAAPLHKLTEKHTIFRWTPCCQEAFDNLKSRLTSAPILALPDWSKPFVLDTDASDTGVGAVLSQVHEGNEFVVAYGSRTLTKSERNYCATKKELLAVVVFLEHFRPYLLGKPFTIRTDHGALIWLQSFKQPEGQIARWLQKLQEYNFSIIHRPGKQHSNADALSRIPCRQCGQLPSEINQQIIQAVQTSDLSFSICSSMELQVSQLEDPIIGPILKAKQADTRPDTSPADNLLYRRLAQLWDQLCVRDGLLYRVFVGQDDQLDHFQLVVPAKLREDVLDSLHGGVAGGHLGHEKTFNRVKERFYWPGYWNDTRDWCLACHQCSTRKSPTHPRRAPLGTIQAGYPMQIMAVDLLGPLPESPQKNSYVMVVGDYFSKWMEAIPLPNQEASTVANHLIDEVFMRYSVPEQLHSDQGRQFESQLIAEVCKLLHIKKTRTTPYHPQCDGMVERFNRTLLNMLATHCKDQPWDWEQHIRKVCMAYNTSVNSTTGYTPFYLMFGRQARLPVDVMYGDTPTDSPSPSEYAVKLKKRLTSAYETVRQTCKAKHEQQKELYDQRIHGNPYVTGDWVWVLNPKVPKNSSKKLFHPWQGPYKIVKKISECVYRIQGLNGRRRRQVVHFNRLKPCPKETRLLEPANSGDNTPRNNTNHEHVVVASRPFGTNLQLIEDDDGDDGITSPQHTSQATVEQTISRRYPVRQRRPPARLNDYVLSSIRDVCSKEGVV